MAHLFEIVFLLILNSSEDRKKLLFRDLLTFSYNMLNQL
jgi:hypothetical protein